MRVVLAVLSFGLLVATLLSLGFLSQSLQWPSSFSSAPLFLEGGIARAVVPDHFNVHLKQQQQQQQQQPSQKIEGAGEPGSTNRTSSWHDCAGQSSSSPSASSNTFDDKPQPLYYQQGLTDLLRLSTPKASPYNPNLQYYPVEANGEVLREYLRQAGSPTPNPEDYRLPRL